MTVVLLLVIVTMLRMEKSEASLRKDLSFFALENRGTYLVPLVVFFLVFVTVAMTMLQHENVSWSSIPDPRDVRQTHIMGLVGAGDFLVIVAMLMLVLVLMLVLCFFCNGAREI